MSVAVEAAAPLTLLLLPGILPFVFAIHHRIVCTSSSASTALTACICVSLLAPLAALSASFGVAAIGHSNSQSLYVAQHAVQCLVELGYRIAIVYLIVQSSMAVDSSRIFLSSRDFRGHNIILLFTIFLAFLLSILHLSLPAIPTSVPPAFGLTAALMPIPLLVHLGLSTSFHRARKIWTFIVVIQLLSAFAAILDIPPGLGYVLARAVCTALWGSGILVLFYALAAAPLPSPVTTPRPRRGPKFALLAPAPAPAPARVHYHTRSLSPNPGVLTSEDFTALRDPFASPPPVSPVSPISPISPISPVFPRPLRPSTPTPMRNLREVHADSPYMSDEAFLSQVLLHSLMQEACGDCPSPEAVHDVQGVREDAEGVEMQAVKVVHTLPAWWGGA